MAKHGRRLELYGDDTWLKLFPGAFTRADGTNSFFVSDFFEVIICKILSFRLMIMSHVIWIIVWLFTANGILWFYIILDWIISAMFKDRMVILCP